MFGQPFGLEADMWSLGCILAELYHGQSLFFAKDKIGVLQKVSVEELTITRWNSFRVMTKYAVLML